MWQLYKHWPIYISYNSKTRLFCGVFYGKSLSSHLPTTFTNRNSPAHLPQTEASCLFRNLFSGSRLTFAQHKTALCIRYTFGRGDGLWQGAKRFPWRIPPRAPGWCLRSRLLCFHLPLPGSDQHDDIMHYWAAGPGSTFCLELRR